MKAIMISDHAKWCALMMNGKKKVEVRKGTTLYKAIQKLINEYGFADIYVYCTKEKPMGKFGDGLYHEITKGSHWSNGCSWNMPKIYLEGKVVFKFRCYKVEEIKTCERHSAELLDQSCLNANEFYDYLTKGKNFLGQVLGCAIHISDLEIFDKPKELSEFKIKSFERIKVMGSPYGDLLGSVAYHYEKKPILKSLTKAPQSWCYVEE